jgi:hypothetical protein
MSSMLNEPRAVNILIEARIEQLRGGRRLATRSRLPRRN